MIESFVDFIVANLLPLGGVGVFLASVLEEVVAPIPSALIMTMSGFVFVTGSVSLHSLYALVFKVAIPAALGVTLGSYVVFFAAKYGGKILIDRFGKYIGLYYSDIEKLSQKLQGTKRDELIIASARVIPIIPSVAISALCGIVNMSVYKYFVISFLGTFVRGLILGVVGWQVGNIYSKYATHISKIESFVLILIALGVVLFVAFRWVHKDRFSTAA